MLLKKWDDQYSKVLDQYYGSACIELMVGERDRAESYFNVTILGCYRHTTHMV